MSVATSLITPFFTTYQTAGASHRQQVTYTLARVHPMLQNLITAMNWTCPSLVGTLWFPVREDTGFNRLAILKAMICSRLQLWCLVEKGDNWTCPVWPEDVYLVSWSAIKKCNVQTLISHSIHHASILASTCQLTELPNQGTFTVKLDRVESKLTN